MTKEDILKFITVDFLEKGVPEMILFSTDRDTQITFLHMLGESGVNIRPVVGTVSGFHLFYVGNPLMCLIVTDHASEGRKVLTWDFWSKMQESFLVKESLGTAVVLDLG